MKMKKADLLRAIQDALVPLGPWKSSEALAYVLGYGQKMYDDGYESGSEESELSEDEIEERGIQAAVERREAMYDQG